jgi:hypothetical protein
LAAWGTLQSVVHNLDVVPTLSLGTLHHLKNVAVSLYEEGRVVCKRDRFPKSSKRALTERKRPRKSSGVLWVYVSARAVSNFGVSPASD